MFVRVTEEERQLLRESIAWQENLSVPGAAVTNRAGSISIAQRRTRKGYTLDVRPVPVVRVTDQISGKIGRYTATAIQGARATESTSHFTAADLGDDEGSEFEIWNPGEENGGPCLLVDDVGPAIRFHSLPDGTQVLLWMGPQNYQLPVTISSATRDGSNWRWTYALTREKKTSDSFDGWAAGSVSFVHAFNGLERDNGASGTVSGITLDSNVTGIKPVPVGTPLHATPYYTGSRVELWFTLPNAPIVDCLTASTGGA